MKPNRMKDVLAEGGVPVGHMVSEFATRGIAKILEPTGIDFVVIDMEHTGHSSERIADLMAWFKAVTVAPFVRVPQPLYHFMARTLDAGGLGVMVPDVKTAGEARTVVEAVKYPPAGNRGVGLGTAHTDYLVPADPASYLSEANEATAVICQIESVQGLENLDAIAATSGVDVLWVGHYDLSVSMGMAGEFQHPDFLAALEKIVAAARKHGKAAAGQPGSQQLAEQWLGMGFNVLSWGADMALYRRCLTAEVRALQETIAKYRGPAAD
jgi:2-dehydro-3-deoxyglucarate aldolase/4-hydroxy-2-oxoheptanedioate aldolase